MIETNDILKIAELAKLKLDSSDVKAVAADLADIIEVAQAVVSVDLTELDCERPERGGVLRRDEVCRPLDADVLLAETGGGRDGYFVGTVLMGSAE